MAPALKRPRSWTSAAAKASQANQLSRDAYAKLDPGAAVSLPLHRYSIDLRAIGQDLERLKVSHFNLECQEAFYLVWSREETLPPAEAGSPTANGGPLRTLWKQISGGEAQQPKTEISAAASSKTSNRYDSVDIDRIERAGKASRQPGSGITDGHSLSQLLRTLGTLIGQRSQRLLAISWQDVSIGVVVETPRGRRQLDLYRHDNVYDFWVKCYLRRAARAYSDVPT
ncbi:MAG: hypothetical protein ACREQ7_03430 [Candidatus Binatia bacterium]